MDGLKDSAFAVAAIRECFEEAGVWLGQGIPSEGARDLLNSHQANLSDMPGLVADLDRMLLWDWWITPEAEPKRYDTFFFLTVLRADEEPEARQDDFEIVDTRWLTAAQAAQAHEEGEMFMAPPTYLCLRQLEQLGSVEAILAQAPKQSRLPVQPVHSREGGILQIILPGHKLHPAAEPRLETERLCLKDMIWILD